MKFSKHITLVILVLFLVIPFRSIAQNEVRIEKKLEKLYQAKAYDNLEKKALKLKKKYPQSDAANYNLSRLQLVYFRQISPLPDQEQWPYLHKASIYAKSLDPSRYHFWRDSLKFYYKVYIDSWNTLDQESAHLKTVLSAYSKYSDDGPTSTGNYRATNPNTTDFQKLSAVDSLRQHIVDYAGSLLGTRYVYGGQSPKKGFDCSGFVKYVYESVNIDLPHSSQQQSMVKGRIITLAEAQPGDLIFFGSREGSHWYTQHAGIIYEYRGSQPKIIHAASRGVIIDGDNASWNSYWEKRILFVKRLPEFEY